MRYIGSGDRTLWVIVAVLLPVGGVAVDVAHPYPSPVPQLCVLVVSLPLTVLLLIRAAAMGRLLSVVQTPSLVHIGVPSMLRASAVQAPAPSKAPAPRALCQARPLPLVAVELRKLQLGETLLVRRDMQPVGRSDSPGGTSLLRLAATA